MFADQPSLFDEENIRRMAHRNALRTEVDAARAIKRKASELQRAICDAFRTHGPMTAGEVEQLPQFASLKPSTARKRCSELFQAEKIRPAGKRGGMTIWELVESPPAV